MSVRRVLAVATVGVLLALESGTGAYAADPDPAYPTGTFTLNRTSTYLHRLTGVEVGTIPAVVVTRVNVADDETAPEDLVVGHFSGPGSDPTYCQEDACILPFYGSGVFAPYVEVTDEDQHTSTIALPNVTVLEDNTGPVVRLTKPRPRLRHRVSAWRVLRGTAVDRGIGLHEVYVTVIQKRRGRWHYFEGESRTWKRGQRTAAATLRGLGGELRPPHEGGRWQTAWLPGLTRGPLVVRVFGFDDNLNAAGPGNTRVRLTRR